MYENFVRKSSKSALQKSARSCGSSKNLPVSVYKRQLVFSASHHSSFGHLPAKFSSMDLEYSVDSSLAGVLANFSAPSSSAGFSSSPPSVIQLSSPSTVSPASWPSASGYNPAVVKATTYRPPTSSVVPSGTVDVGQRRLAEGLEEAAKMFREATRPSPPVVVINQLPPALPSPSWHQDPDLPAVSAAVGFIILILLVAGCVWLRRYRPDYWKTVKSKVWGIVTWLALPLSWCCGQLAALLHQLHSSAESQRASSANTVQVSKTDSLYRLIVYCYEGTKYMYMYNIYIYGYDICLGTI